MYGAMLVVLLAASLALIALGIRKRRWSIGLGGLAVGVVTIVFFSVLNLWAEMLWFGALGYSGRFWTVLFAKLKYAVAAGAVACGLVWLGTLAVPRRRKFLRWGPRLLAAFIGVIWGASNWGTILKFLHRVPTDLKDPILGRSTGFYLFTLPFYDVLYSLLLLLAFVLLASFAIAAFIEIRIGDEGELTLESWRDSGSTDLRRFRPLFIGGTALLLVLAWGRYLARFHLMYSYWGVVRGPGWTDVHVRLPAYWVVVVVAVLAAAGLILLYELEARKKRFSRRFGTSSVRAVFTGAGVIGGLVFLVWLVALGIVPAMFQWLRVEPNEISLESPYIAHNIEFTRQGFGLHRVEEREFPVTGNLTQEMMDENRGLFQNIRLWDWRALKAVYRQFQEIRLYYQFEDVDIDRYHIDGEYRQVMISARELNISNLPPQSQTFVNRRFKYTHGYGLVLNTVSEFTPQGLPNLLVKNIPPVTAYDSLKVEVPQIYYGELTETPVVANSEEEEFDYPRGEKNAYIRYAGKGGVRMGGLWRKFLFGWKFDGTRFFLSGYPRPDSRIMFRRRITERIRRLAPFLRLDRDPYVVLIDGHILWIVDAYTTSADFPYSESFASIRGRRYRGDGRGAGRGYLVAPLERINYIRNSVKVVVDAFNGSVDFYVMEPEDPLIQVWRRIFPKLFKDREEMPDKIFEHVRYPADLLLYQGLVYSKYHMTNPAVFYNQEDLWVRATEKYYNEVVPVDPYYIMWKPPDAEEMEFVLMLPFTPKNRQVLIGWIAGMCDGENYGRFVAYRFPKEKRVLGTQQVETKIDQDSVLSQRLTLWDQRGSRVVRGNVLAIPVEKTLMYVEPIYLQAETAAYPELRLVAVMHGDRLSYAGTFGKALRGLFEEGEVEVAPERPVRPAADFDALIDQANSAFETYLRHTGEGRYEKAAQALDKLEQSLKQLKEKSSTRENQQDKGEGRE